MKSYTLKKLKNSKECHLFEGDTRKTGHNLDEISLCNKMYKHESDDNVFIGYDENVTRSRIAIMGRQVCGECVSHLYATY